jgi:hypothetical protein
MGSENKNEKQNRFFECAGCTGKAFHALQGLSAAEGR